jgi:hypothetical protein
VPEAHLLDLTLTIAPDLVLIAQDGMTHEPLRVCRRLFCLSYAAMAG